MKKFSPQQINDIESQVYLISNIAKNINSYIFNNKEELEPKFKLNSLFNAIAKRNGYTSWSHLKLTNKKSIDNHEFVGLFSDEDDLYNFLDLNIKGLNSKAHRAIHSFIPFKKDYEFPFIQEVCNFYELRLVDLSEEIPNTNPAYCFYDSGDHHVGLPAFYTKMYFESKESLELFICENIKEIRDSFLHDDFDKFADIFTAK